MSVATSALSWGEKAFQTLGILCALIALWMWVQALLAWGTPGAFASALMWTVITVVATLPTAAIRRIRGA